MPAASTASLRWLPPTARSRMKNKTFIPTTKRRSAANRKAEGRRREHAMPGAALAPPLDPDLWSAFATVEELRSAVWRVGHFTGFRIVVGRSRQPHDFGLRREYPRRPAGRSRPTRSLRRAEHRLHLGNRRAPVLRHECGDARRTSRAQAALHRRATLLLQLSRRGRGRRGARPLLLRPLAHQADSRPPGPGNRNAYLLAFLLPGGGKRRRGLSR